MENTVPQSQGLSLDCTAHDRYAIHTILCQRAWYCRIYVRTNRVVTIHSKLVGIYILSTTPLK